MSTKAALDYDEFKPWRSCVICDGRFVEHSYWENRLVDPPHNTCLWCWSRKSLYRRYNKLYEALKISCSFHEDQCQCLGCATLERAMKIMEEKDND